jgi:hypothetical protein
MSKLIPMLIAGGLMLWPSYCALASPLGEPSIQVTPAGSPPGEVDQIDSIYPNDFKKMKIHSGPGPTDLDGKAGGASGTKAGNEFSESERSVFKEKTKTLIDEWDYKIALLNVAAAKDFGQAQVAETERQLDAMQRQARADLNELDKVNGKDWVDVKARLEARFKTMQKKFKRVEAE